MLRRIRRTGDVVKPLGARRRAREPRPPNRHPLSCDRLALLSFPLRWNPLTWITVKQTPAFGCHRQIRADKNRRALVGHGPSWLWRRGSSLIVGRLAAGVERAGPFRPLHPPSAPSRRYAGVAATPSHPADCESEAGGKQKQESTEPAPAGPCAIQSASSPKISANAAPGHRFKLRADIRSRNLG